MSFDSVAMNFGYLTMAVGGILLVSGLIILAATASNYTQRKVVDSFYGWKAFYEFREWFHKTRKEI